MKVAVAVILVIGLLTGCNTEDKLLDRAMNIRKSILDSGSCTFQSDITADYGEKLYTFQMECSADNECNLQFTVTDPETISGITGRIGPDDASLTFDERVLAFPKLSNGEITPVSAPWIFINTLQRGYITGCSQNNEEFCIFIDDSYEENPLHLEIYTDQDMVPVHADIIWQERRILSLDIRNFRIG